MIFLITGVPGAGKTLRAVHFILEAQKTGRLIYTNIDDLQIDGVHSAPQNWQETPEGSLVVYDEAQQIFPADNRSGRSQRDDITGMELHRHTGHDLILVTQHPYLIHSHVRRLIGKHEHLVRAFGWNKANIYLKDSVMRPDAKSDLQSAEQTLWNHDKKLFRYYKSASLHVEHKRIPKPLIYMGLVAVLMIGVIAYFSDRVLALNPQSDNFIGKMSATEKPDTLTSSAIVSTVPRAGPYYYTGVNPPDIVMAGCIASATYCRCWDEALNPIFMEQIACYKALDKPIIRRLNQSAGDGAAHEGAAPPPALIPSFDL